MNLMGNNTITILTYVFLYLTVISLWGILLVTSILLGLVSHRLDLTTH